MLARQYCLKGKKSFEKVNQDGRLFQSESFGVAVLTRGDKEVSRFGFIVSSKISKEAVQRNRIKRALSEAVRFEMALVKPGYDVVFLAKHPSLKKPTDGLMREVREFLPETGITK
ncbi:MAG: ribonuclease P protein component [Patescibacteria group bacterium]